LSTAPIATSPEHLALQAELLHQRAERLDRHAEVADVEVVAVVLAEGDADAAQDGDATARAHSTFLGQGGALSYCAAIAYGISKLGRMDGNGSGL
jgi:hypothetical protein